MLRKFTLEEVQHVDGGTVAVAFNKLLAEAVRDCADRPGQETCREVTLTVKIKPLLHVSGSMDQIKGVVSLKGKRPNYETPEITFDARREGGSHVIVWNDMSEEDPKQRTIDEYDDK